MNNGLEAYILGLNRTSEQEFLHKCTKCQSTKKIPMFYELGGWVYLDEDDIYCEYCEVPMELIEED